MAMFFTRLPKPAIIAHRGASAYAPENTLAAFELAIRQNADAIELDTKLTADGQVVVFHDNSVSRTTSGNGRVKDLTLADLQKMGVRNFSDYAYNGAPIPTLDEVFKAFGQLTLINIELKNYDSLTDELPEKVANLVRSHRLSHRVLFSSFNPLALLRIHRLIPDAPIGLLAIRGRKGALARSWPGRLLSYQSLHIHLKDTTPELLSKLHRQGSKCFTYTVNQELDMRRLFKMGVDGIISDDPVLARQVLDEVMNASQLQIKPNQLGNL